MERKRIKVVGPAIGRQTLDEDAVGGQLMYSVDRPNFLWSPDQEKKNLRTITMEWTEGKG